jgi:hypothetical protein
MSRPKSRQVGTAGLVLRHRDGTCSRTCQRCGQWDRCPGWRAALRAARQHAAAHDAADARYVGTPWGIPAHELPPARRRRPLRRLAAAVVVLALAALAFTLTLANVTGHAAPASAPAPAAPSIAVVPTTTVPATAATPGPEPEGHVPTPAGPPATDAGGTWIPEPDQPPTSPASSSAGGER